jgi:hypothetical protein
LTILLVHNPSVIFSARVPNTVYAEQITGKNLCTKSRLVVCVLELL